MLKVSRKLTPNVPRLGEGPAFETRQPKPKLNKRSNANTSFTG